MKTRREIISGLSTALDDGQEVKMFKLTGAVGYCVIIFGDCCCESRSKGTLEEAITEASKKYVQWCKNNGDAASQP